MIFMSDQQTSIDRLCKVKLYNLCVAATRLYGYSSTVLSKKEHLHELIWWLYCDIQKVIHPKEYGSQKIAMLCKYIITSYLPGRLCISIRLLFAFTCMPLHKKIYREKKKVC